MEERKAKLSQEREETENVKRELADERATLQRKTGELQERELELSQRENALNNAARDLRNRQYNAYANAEYSYAPPPAQNNNYYGYYAQPAQQPAPAQPTGIGYGELRERADAEGIKLNTAGNMRTHATPVRNQASASGSVGNCYNAGLTLFKSAFIIFCIIAFECLVVFFLKDYLGVSVAYPIVGFALGFAAFITCAILYSFGFKSRVRRKKHASYILTAAVIFVIAVIVVTMIAVYCKAQTSIPSQLLSYVIIPVVYLLNILFFVLFYYLFSVRASKENR